MKTLSDMLGNEYKDKISGLTGVCTGVVEYISGCHQAVIQPKMGADGKITDSAWFDVQRLELTGNADRIVLDNGATPGFDKAPPKR